MEYSMQHARCHYFFTKQALESEKSFTNLKKLEPMLTAIIIIIIIIIIINSLFINSLFKVG